MAAKQKTSAKLAPKKRGSRRPAALMGLKTDRVYINNPTAWGELVKLWVKGKQTPRTLDELRQQCKDQGLTISIPAYVTGVMFTQAPKEVLFIRLPPQELVEDTEKALKKGASYELPDFYAKRFTGPLVLPDDDAKLAFHAERIGDYTITLCV